MSGNLLYAQSGGVTAVINQSASAVIRAAKSHPVIENVFAAKNGITGILSEQLYACDGLDLTTIESSPGGYFGSCRYKLPAPGHAHHQAVMERILSVLEAHNIQYFLYNGGGDSQDTLLKVARFAEARGYPLRCVGIPKTIDNDLMLTDCSPGFGSAAKFLASTTVEIACDLRSMHHNSTRIFVLEVMGRNAGWLAAATALAGDVDPMFAPDAILLPERPYNPSDLLHECRQALQRKGYCMVVASEGIFDQQHHHLIPDHDLDAFGHPQLGGIAPQIASFLHQHTAVKTRWATPDYLQRAARHLASKTDIAQAREVGKVAVERAAEGANGVMTVIQRTSDNPYQWRVGDVPIEEVANRERLLPAEFLDPSRLGVTQKALDHIRPLIAGEDYPKFTHGLPSAGYCALDLVPQKLDAYMQP